MAIIGDHGDGLAFVTYLLDQIAEPAALFTDNDGYDQDRVYDSVA